MKRFLRQIKKVLFHIGMGMLICIALCFCGCQSEKKQGLLVNVQADTALQSIYNVDTRITQKFLSKSEWQKDSIGGDYTGNAVRFDVLGKGYQSYGYRMKAQVSQEEYENIKKQGYEQLYIWICIVYTGTEKLTLTNYNSTAVNDTTRTYGKEEQGRWFQLKVNLTASLKSKLFDENGAAQEAILFRTHFDTTDTAAHLTLYIGDIGLCS